MTSGGCVLYRSIPHSRQSYGYALAATRNRLPCALSKKKAGAAPQLLPCESPSEMMLRLPRAACAAPRSLLECSSDF